MRSSSVVGLAPIFAGAARSIGGAGRFVFALHIPAPVPLIVPFIQNVLFTFFMFVFFAERVPSPRAEAIGTVGEGCGGG